MSNFQNEYNQLNPNQRKAVNSIDGPLLVIAGPGTGKTQLLSARVAQILQKTDTLAQNILCLTFTDSGAQNMRERLTRFIGIEAHNVNISTYHAFGGDLIKRFPEYFTETRLQEPIDEIIRHKIISDIVDTLSYLDPLKQTRHHIGDLIATISETKRALLTSKDLNKIAKENSNFISQGNKDLSSIFSNLNRMPGKFVDALPYFNNTLELIKNLENKSSGKYVSLSKVAHDSLEASIIKASEINSSKPLTAWKNKWLAKNADNQYIFAGELQNKRIESLARVLEKYQDALENRGLYDFDDMIIRAIQSLEKNTDFRFTLQENYQYLLLDEFQDTNAAQLRLVELLSNNPVNEGRPNVMVVGDDDQAIYAFQGANYSNMLDFYNMYKDVQVILLENNYRSHKHIIHTAQNVIKQVEQRLSIPGTKVNQTKILTASNSKLPETASISRNEFISEIAQSQWIANEISDLISAGVEPRDIAILAPKHRNLEPLVPYLNYFNIPVRYEKREDILSSPVVSEIITICKLVLSIANNDGKLANSLWPQVLSFDFWNLPIETIWQISWSVSEARSNENNWTKLLMENPKTKNIGLLFVGMAGKANTESLETMLDIIIGSEEIKTNDTDVPTVRSELKQFYLSKNEEQINPQQFYEALSHIKVLRENLRQYQKSQEKPLFLTDLIDYIQMYEAAGKPIMNTNPYNQDANAVQIMTVFKAKGLEFGHVFLPYATDETWGESSQNGSNKLTLPPNLMQIRHAGTTDDERLRILYVALTRAKYGLHITSYTQTYTGKSTKRLKYLDEQEQTDGTFKAMVLPNDNQGVIMQDTEQPNLEQLALDWRHKHTQPTTIAQLKHLLSDRLDSYKLSPTHLNSFTDVEYGGPEAFFYSTILKFPQAPTLASQYGTAMHDTMEWIQDYVNQHDASPSLPIINSQLSKFLRSKKLTEEQFALECERGENALSNYMRERSHIFKSGDKAEQSFWRENITFKQARLNGKIDRLEIDEVNKQIVVVDYKTGKSYSKWKNDIKLHKYKQQLYFYKLLLENSNAYGNYEVTEGRLEFLEPDENNRINTLALKFNKSEEEYIQRLILAVWKYIQNLEFPDVTVYSHNLKGALEFEKYLTDS